MPSKRKVHQPNRANVPAKQQTRKSAAKRGYNRNWRKARQVHLAENPQCAMCGKLEGFNESWHVDHIKDHLGDYDVFWDSDNWQTLCPSCHSKKTNQTRLNHGR